EPAHDFAFLSSSRSYFPKPSSCWQGTGGPRRRLHRRSLGTWRQRNSIDGSWLQGRTKDANQLQPEVSGLLTSIRGGSQARLPAFDQFQHCLVAGGFCIDLVEHLPDHLLVIADRVVGHVVAAVLAGWKPLFGLAQKGHRVLFPRVLKRPVQLCWRLGV